jgi:hypothetical protein
MEHGLLQLSTYFRESSVLRIAARDGRCAHAEALDPRVAEYLKHQSFIEWPRLRVSYIAVRLTFP